VISLPDGSSWHTRKVLIWRISDTLDADFCPLGRLLRNRLSAMVEALNEALRKFGPRASMNTDQGSQFTSFARTGRLRRSGAHISMDGKGRFLDNIFAEGLWRSPKYGCVYLHTWETGSQAKAGVGKWIEICNRKRIRSAPGGKPPAVVPWLIKTKPDPISRSTEQLELRRKPSEHRGVAQEVCLKMNDNRMPGKPRELRGLTPYAAFSRICKTSRAIHVRTALATVREHRATTTAQTD